jgi:hypothetical protein
MDFTPIYTQNNKTKHPNITKKNKNKKVNIRRERDRCAFSIVKVPIYRQFGLTGGQLKWATLQAFDWCSRI